MKVALVQAPLHAGSRSANLMALSRAVDAAADHEAAPDLLVLPADCDARPYAIEPRCVIGYAAAVRETLSRKAREWGVYIAAGLTVTPRGGRSRHAVLLDPDGDVLCSTGGDVVSSDDTPPELDTATLPGLGCVGVRTAPLVIDIRSFTPPFAGMLMVMPVSVSPDAPTRRSDREAVRTVTNPAFARNESFWAVAAGAESRQPRRKTAQPSFVVGPDGGLIAACSHCDTCVLVVDLDLRKG